MIKKLHFTFGYIFMWVWLPNTLVIKLFESQDGPRTLLSPGPHFAVFHFSLNILCKWENSYLKFAEPHPFISWAHWFTGPWTPTPGVLSSSLYNIHIILQIPSHVCLYDNLLRLLGKITNPSIQYIKCVQQIWCIVLLLLRKPAYGIFVFIRECDFPSGLK